MSDIKLIKIRDGVIINTKYLMCTEIEENSQRYFYLTFTMHDGNQILSEDFNSIDEADNWCKEWL